jgi:PAS domain S-box-containing protein
MSVIFMLVLCLISPSHVSAGQATSQFQVGITITGKPDASAAPPSNPQPLRLRMKKAQPWPATPNGNGAAIVFGARLARSFGTLGKRLSAAEIALHASEEQRRLAIEAAELAPWSWDLVKGEMWWSDRMRQIIGVPDSMPANHTIWYDRVHPSDRHLVQEIFSRRVAGERFHDHEYRIVRLDDGAMRYLSSKGQTTFDESGKPISVLGVVQDITAHKAAELARDDLRRSLMHAQEQERLRLARELHDEAGQSLAAVQMQLKRIESTASEPEQADLRALHSQLERMGAALHRISCELRPASMDELGLATVLANYVAEWSSHFSVSADFHCRDINLDQLPDEIRTTIYRVTQEALTNIGRHALGVTSASVVIDRVEGEIRLTIEDNGCGFEAAAADRHGGSRQRGLGLAGIRERLALMGGSLEVESSSAGSTIFARIIVNPAKSSPVPATKVT